MIKKRDNNNIQCEDNNTCIFHTEIHFTNFLFIFISVFFSLMFLEFNNLCFRKSIFQIHISQKLVDFLCDWDVSIVNFFRINLAKK
jgi:hypothetical protein